MRRTILAAALTCAVIVLSACGEQQPAKSSKPATPASAPAAKPAPAPAAKPAPAVKPAPAPAKPAAKPAPKKAAAKPAPKKAAAKPAQNQASKPGVVLETVQAVDKAADYATGRTQLQAKKRMQNKLQNIQQGHQNQYNKALEEN